MQFDRIDMFSMGERRLADGSVSWELPSYLKSIASGGAETREGAGIAGWGRRQRCQPWIVAQLNEAYNTLTSLTLFLEYSDDNSAWHTVVTTGAVAQASLTLGAVLINQAFPAIPAGINARYIRGRWDISGSAPTTGRLTFGILLDGLRDTTVMTNVLRRRVPTAFDYFPGDRTRGR